MDLRKIRLLDLSLLKLVSVSVAGLFTIRPSSALVLCIVSVHPYNTEVLTL